MFLLRKALCVVGAFGLSVVPQASAQTLIRVYVQAGNGGFSANGASDTALDLTKALRGKSRTLQVVEAPDSADLIIRIESRNERKQVSSVTTYEDKSDDGKRGTATTTPNNQTIKVLHGTLVAGDFQMPLQDESPLSWRLAASDMASDVDHWAKENYAKLIERRMDARRERSTAQMAPQTAVSRVPPAQPTQTDTAAINPGMTEERVTSAMGSPDKKVVFGKKSLWNYRGMQVVFEDGKVTDVRF